MRNLLPSLFLCVAGLAANATDGESAYKPMLEMGKQWKYMTVDLGMDTENRVPAQYLEMKIDGTKDIDGKQWYCLSGYDNGTHIDDPEPIAYLREDADAQQVWAIYNSDNTAQNLLASAIGCKAGEEILLYSFKSAKPNGLYIPGFTAADGNEALDPDTLEYGDDTFCGHSFALGNGSKMYVVESLGYVRSHNDPCDDAVQYCLFGDLDAATGGILDHYFVTFHYEVQDGNGNAIYKLSTPELSRIISAVGDKAGFAAKAAAHGTIEVQASGLVEVYAANGALVASAVADGKVSFRSLPRGIYIVRHGAKAAKVAL